MNPENLNKWLTLGANVGVLIGIFLLVYELNQNRMAMQSQTRNSIAETLVEILLTESVTPELINVQAKKAAGELLWKIPVNR